MANYYSRYNDLMWENKIFRKFHLETEWKFVYSDYRVIVNTIKATVISINL